MLLALSACSDRSFVGRRVDNFSAYYNTFYNAQKAYDEGAEALEAEGEPVTADVYLPLFRGAERAPGAQFDEAIEKSADVLRSHPSSKWVDDALMLIGKSYYHQNNFVGAEQKFREVITRGGSKEDEARFWLARALITAGDYNAAEEHLLASLDEGGSLDGWRGMLDLALGALRVEQGDWEAAAAALEKGLKGKVRGDEVRARAWFLLGQVSETLGRYGAAAQAYARAAEERPRYELSYAAQIGAVRARGAQGQADAALDRLRRMERDDKNAEKRAEMALLRGQLYKQQGRPAEAQRALTDLLYGDEDAPLPAEVRGRAHYTLATLYREAFGSYSRAAAHFDTAATALRSGAGSLLRSTPAAVTDSRQQAEAFGRVAEAARRVERYDSLLRLGRLSEAEFATFVDELRQRRAREAEAARRARAEDDRAERFAGRSEGFEGEDFEDEDGALGQAANTASESASFLFHDDPARAQQAYVGFVERWGRRPLVPHWRRLRAISGETRTVAQGAPAEEAGPGRREPALPQRPGVPDLDLSDVPRDPDSRAAMEAERATARYELANALFFAVNRPDSAVAWYRRVIEDGAGRPVEQRAYYAMAEAHDALGQDQQAASLYRQIVDRYPESSFAERALAQLREEEEGRAPVANAAAADAEAAYEEAYATWQRGAHLQALRGMTDVAATHPGTDEAPRALLAAGQIALEWTAHTGRSPLTRLPVTVADSLTAAGGLLAADDVETAAPDTAAIPSQAPPATDPLNLTAATLDAPAPEAALLSAADLPGLRARTYFASVVAHYPESPHAARARLVLHGLGERQAAERPRLAEAAVPANAPPAEEPPPQEEPPRTFDPETPAEDEEALAEEDEAASAARTVFETAEAETAPLPADSALTAPPPQEAAVLETAEADSAETVAEAAQRQAAAARAEKERQAAAERQALAEAMAETESEQENAQSEIAPDSSAAIPEADSLEAADVSIAENTAEARGEDEPEAAAEAPVPTAPAPETDADSSAATPEADEPPADPRKDVAEGDAQALPPSRSDERPVRTAERAEAVEAEEETLSAAEADAARWRAALYGAGRVTSEAGGWTVAVASAGGFAAADAAAQGYHAQGYRAGAIARAPGGAGPRYRIGLGQFATREAAEAAAAHLRGALASEGAAPEAVRPLFLGETAASAEIPFEEAPSERASSLEEGTLSVRVQPWGAIYINGTLRQEEADARYTTALPAGRHRVTVTHPQLGTWEREVDVEAGGERRLTVNLNRAASGAAASEPLRALTSAEAAALRDNAPVEPGAGGWTLVVASASERPQAELVAERYRRRGFRVGILSGEAEGQAYFRVGVGQFAEEAAARAALSKLEGDLPQDAWLMPLAEEGDAQRN